MRKLLGIVVLGLLWYGNVYAEIIEYKECWIKSKKVLDHNLKTSETYYKDKYHFKKIRKIEFEKYSINATTNSLVQTIKYSEDNSLFLDKLAQASYQIESWDNEYLKASGDDFFGNGKFKKKISKSFLINMSSGEIQFTMTITQTPSKEFHSTTIYQIVCDEIPSDTTTNVVGSSGTAFFISNRGHLLTNNHVVEGCSISKITYKNKDYDTKLLATDKTLDLALLKAEVRPKSFFNFSKDDVKKLNKVYVAGYPLGKGLSDDLKISSGIVSSLKGFEDNSNEIQIDAPINPGNSGGPIINENGDLIAIAVSGLAKDQTEGINFGIKSSAAETFLRSNKINPKKSMHVGIKDNDKLLEILEEGTVYTYCD